MCQTNVTVAKSIESRTWPVWVIRFSSVVAFLETGEASAAQANMHSAKTKMATRDILATRAMWEGTRKECIWDGRRRREREDEVVGGEKTREEYLSEGGLIYADPWALRVLSATWISRAHRHESLMPDHRTRRDGRGP